VKPYRVHREAADEYAQAADYYAQIRPELGRRFFTEIQSLIADVSLRPALYRRHMGEVRRHFSTVFPYGILYRKFADEIRIWAVMPLRRDPGYWRGR